MALAIRNAMGTQLTVNAFNDNPLAMPGNATLVEDNISGVANALRRSMTRTMPGRDWEAKELILLFGVFRVEQAFIIALSHEYSER
jgi:hypothetical protein